MRVLAKLFFGFIILAMFLAGCTEIQENEIFISSASGTSQQFAAKELRRYIYHASGKLLPIRELKSGKQISSGGYLIYYPGDSLVEALLPDSLRQLAARLDSQDILIKSLKLGNNPGLLLTGGSEQAVLHAVYRYAETLGIRFYLHGDVIPDEQKNIQIGQMQILETPAFALRGIQPFHDFPEGPDWWSLDEYKSVISQLAKMRMNFIGFHTYPESESGAWARAEPMVWIGLKEDVNGDGTVTSAYPVMHSHTADSTWGYHSKKTSDFSYGASQLFEADDYGANYMLGSGPWPPSEEANIAVFNEFGSWQDEAFTLAKRLGVKTCMGTETPLVIPARVKDKLKAMGINPASAEATQIVYEGIFTRISKLHPLDYYWFWTPEGWTWNAVSAEQVRQTNQDLLLAVEASKKVDAPFTLATCGWVLGPPADRAAFDRLLPKEMPFSCINREVGFAPVEPGFAAVQGRPKWQISWLEDDPALISPQLWAGRVMQDAYDALRYGCTGMMGIHWRTQNLAPAFGALQYSGWKANALDTTARPTDRDLSSAAFYLDFAEANFGKNVAEKFAALFTKLDGGPLFIPGKNERVGKLPRTSDWMQTGPGGVKSDTRPWERVEKDFDFVEEFEDLGELISGNGARERYTFWLQNFRYTRSLAYLGCLLGRMDSEMNSVLNEKDPAKQREAVESVILPLRDSIGAAWGNSMTLLLSFVSSSGDLGTVANLEMHNLGQLQLLSKHEAALNRILDGQLEKLVLEKEYKGDPRIIVPVRRSTLSEGEPLRLKVLLLGMDETSTPVLYWRKLGKTDYKEKPFTHTARGVWQLVLSWEEYGDKDFEYHIDVEYNSETHVFPVTSPEQDATVVIDNGI